MPQILKRITVCLFFSLAFVLKPAAQKTEIKAEKMMKELMAKEHVPGLAYAVVKDGKILSINTLGEANLPYNAAVTRQTVFQTASCSKIFCALLLGKLFDKGILKPETTLKEIFDSIPDKWKDISILQLAAHQSGIKIANFSKTSNSKEALEEAKKMDMEFEPGTKAAYVSSDYWILLAVIEKVTGKKYFDALKEQVLRPLNLQHTFVANPVIGYTTDIDIVPQQAQEYHWFKKDSMLRISVMNFKETDYAAGGIYTSIEDLATVAGQFDKGDFLSAQTKKLISNPVILKDGKPGNYGLSLVVRDNYQGHKIVEHSGGPALADFVRFDKEKLTFIVLTNNRGVYPYLAKSLATVYLPALKLPEVPKGWK